TAMSKPASSAAVIMSPSVIAGRSSTQSVKSAAAISPALVMVSTWRRVAGYRRLVSLRNMANHFSRCTDSSACVASGLESADSCLVADGPHGIHQLFSTRALRFMLDLDAPGGEVDLCLLHAVEVSQRGFDLAHAGRAIEVAASQNRLHGLAPFLLQSVNV